MAKKKHTLKYGRLSAITIRIFDILSDGEWHEATELQWEGALALISDDFDAAVARGQVLRAKSVRSGRSVEEYDFALSGGNDRARNNLDISTRTGRVIRKGNKYRMRAETRQQWLAIRESQRRESTVMTEGHDPLKIRTFAGINEHDAFKTVPLIRGDRLTFKTYSELPMFTYVANSSTSWTFTRDDSTGLCRLDGPVRHGLVMEAFVYSWCEEVGIRPYEVRTRTNVRTRDLNDFDPNFLNEMVAFYQPFLTRRLRAKAQSTLDVHIPDREDQFQQIGEWIIGCVREYDETMNVPFGAFLIGRISHRVHDLSRSRLGRTAADHQNAKSKLLGTFTQQHGRVPTDHEMAHLMNKTSSEYDQIAASLDAANKVFDAASIEGLAEADQEVHIASTSDASAALIEADTRYAQSAALIEACLTGDDPDLAAFGYWYYHCYQNMNKTETSAALGISPQAVTSAADRGRERLTAALSGFLTEQ